MIVLRLEPALIPSAYAVCVYAGAYELACCLDIDRLNVSAQRAVAQSSSTSQWKGAAVDLADLGLVCDTNMYFDHVSITVLKCADVGPRRK